jgi:DNA-binding MarR family transcriptional regulator
MRVSLADFLGSTSEIIIIDFLAENMDMAYNQTELRKCLGMSRTIINQKIPILIYNNIIEVKECKGNTKKYGLKKNSLVNKLISIIYEHSFMMAECEEEEEE